MEWGSHRHTAPISLFPIVDANRIVLIRVLLVQGKSAPEGMGFDGGLIVQIIHGERTMYNVRDGTDVARFLAKATKEDINGHFQNLRRVAAAFCP